MQSQPTKDHNWSILVLKEESPSGADNCVNGGIQKAMLVHRMRVAASCLPKTYFKYGRQTNGNINMEKINLETTRKYIYSK